jgi:hypothetical protein
MKKGLLEGIRRDLNFLIVAAAIIYCEGAFFWGKSLNPLNWYGNIKEQVARSDKIWEGVINEQKRIDDLINSAVKKAEMYDGKLGMSLEDQAQLTHSLGYNSTLYEGVEIGLVRVNLNYMRSQPGIELVHYNGSSWEKLMYVPEDKLKEYIDRK